jgi:hypothetical protein
MFRLLRENIRIGRFGRFGRDFLMSIFDIGDMSKPIIRSNPVFRPIHPKVQSKNAVSKPSNQEKSSKPGTDADGAQRVQRYFDIIYQQIDYNRGRIGRKSVRVIIGGHIGLDTKISSWRGDSSA